MSAERELTPQEIMFREILRASPECAEAIRQETAARYRQQAIEDDARRQVVRTLGVEPLRRRPA